jgi:hypothetical protein
VSLFANGVRRLSNKMNSQGGLSKSEEGLLDTHMHLLRQKVYQLHGPMVFIPQPPQRHQQQQQQQQPQHHLHLQQSLMTQPINRHIAPCSDSPPTTAPRPASPQRRRTKRMFTDRACHHCETRFTSQWRTGPSGPSTYVTHPLNLSAQSSFEVSLFAFSRASFSLFAELFPFLHFQFPFLFFNVVVGHFYKACRLTPCLF